MSRQLPPRHRGRLMAFASLTALLVATGNVSATSRSTVGRQPDGSVVLPTGQRITPAGTQVEFPGRPVAVAVRPDGRTAAFLAGTPATGGSAPLVDVVDLQSAKVIQQFNPVHQGASFAGLAYSPDGSRLYASMALGDVAVAAVAADGTLSDQGFVPLVAQLPRSGCQNHLIPTLLTPATGDFPTTNPLPAGLGVSPDGTRLYVALSCQNSLAVVDTATRRVLAQIPVGNAPHSVVVRGNTAYVANRGGRPARPGDFTRTSSGTPIVADRNRGSAITGTVSVVDLDRQAQVATVPVGLQPSEMLLVGDHLLVTNTNSDSVSVIDTRRRRVVRTFDVTPVKAAANGVAPNALAMLPGGRLAVSLGRANAVAVYAWRGAGAAPVLKGLIPTGGYPAALALDPTRRRLLVANNRGVGHLGPESTNALRVPPDPKKAGKNTRGSLGSASLVTFPTDRELQAGMRTVASNNSWRPSATASARSGAAPVPVPRRVGEPSTIEHVVFIIKENRTYDQVLGDDPRGNGDAALVEYGERVTPNQHAIAHRWSLFDNLYSNGSLSADGHQWVTQANQADYLEKSGNNPVAGRSYPFDGSDPLAYAPSGFLWENAVRHAKSVRVFGEYADRANPTRSYVPSLDRLLNRDFPNFDLTISDQRRADVFLTEFADYVRRGSMPNLVMMLLGQDHTLGTTPEYPTPAAQVADNDLAVGRILDALSHSRFWSSTAVFVVEDDAQGGWDHVDGARTTAFVASPWAARGKVNSSQYNQVNLVRTIEQILGLPPMNLMDRAATPMFDAFTNRPDVSPYTVVEPSPTILAARNPSLASLTGLERAWALACAAMDFSTPDIESNRELLNRALWYAAKGFHTPYPADSRVLHPSEVLPREDDVVR